MTLNQYFSNNSNLESNKRVIDYTYGSNYYQFLSDNGVFSKNKIDYGSIKLVEAFLKSQRVIHSFLDVGCGYGFLAIVLAKELGLNGIGVDINLRAISLAQENARLNQVNISFIESNIYEHIEGSFDLIITNPPIRAGKKVVLDILVGAKNHLHPGGELWFVIRKDQGAKSIIKILEKDYEIRIVEKNKGFYIIVAKTS